MLSISDIEKTLAALPVEEMAEFRAWFEAFYASKQDEKAHPVTPEQWEELERRMDAIEAGEMPPAEPWDQVKIWLKSL